MLFSNDLNYFFNMPLNLKSSNDLIKKEAFKMKDYSSSNEAFQIALATLKSESRYNVGLIEAKEEGFEEGYQQGYQQGLEQGFEEWKKKVVLNLYQMGKKIEFIAEVFNISVDEVNKILNM